MLLRSNLIWLTSIGKFIDRHKKKWKILDYFREKKGDHFFEDCVSRFVNIAWKWHVIMLWLLNDLTCRCSRRWLLRVTVFSSYSYDESTDTLFYQFAYGIDLPFLLSVMIRSMGYFSGFPSFFHRVSHHSVNVSKLCGRLGLSYFWNVITTCLIYWDVAKIDGICFQLSNSIQTRSA